MDPTKEMTDYILEAPEACSHGIREQALQQALEPLFLCSLVLVILQQRVLETPIPLLSSSRDSAPFCR